MDVTFFHPSHLVFTGFRPVRRPAGSQTWGVSSQNQRATRFRSSSRARISPLLQGRIGAFGVQHVAQPGTRARVLVATTSPARGRPSTEATPNPRPARCDARDPPRTLILLGRTTSHHVASLVFDGIPSGLRGRHRSASDVGLGFRAIVRLPRRRCPPRTRREIAARAAATPGPAAAGAGPGAQRRQFQLARRGPRRRRRPHRGRPPRDALRALDPPRDVRVHPRRRGRLPLHPRRVDPQPPRPRPRPSRRPAVPRAPRPDPTRRHRRERARPRRRPPRPRGPGPTARRTRTPTARPRPPRPARLPSAPPAAAVYLARAPARRRCTRRRNTRSSR